MTIVTILAPARSAPALVPRSSAPSPKIAYEPAANRITGTGALGFAQERDHVILEQREVIRALSVPVLPVREWLSIVPIIGAMGAMDAQRVHSTQEEKIEEVRTRRL